MMIKNFFTIIAGGFFGGVCGAITGFVLMFLVRGLIALAFFLIGASADADLTQPIAVFSIGSGTVLGGIFGAVLMLRKTKE